VRKAHRVLAGLLFAVVLVCAVPGIYFFWAQHRSPPPALTRQIVAGVQYERIVYEHPRKMVLHTMTIDLSTPGLQFIVTPPAPGGGHLMSARKTSTFAREFDCDAAINGNYFRPFWSNMPWDYYPHAGDGCDVVGIAASAGDLYGAAAWRPGVVYLSADNRVTIDESPPPEVGVFNAIAGNGLLVRNGRVTKPLESDEQALKPYPRAAIALNYDHSQMVWVVLDGKQLGYSEGATLAEFAEILVGLNADIAVRMDEGGSATLVGRNEAGMPVVLNSVTNTRIIGRERPVANHLGLRVR
jgi:hypothetical protein